MIVAATRDTTTRLPEPAEGLGVLRNSCWCSQTTNTSRSTSEGKMPQDETLSDGTGLSEERL